MRYRFLIVLAALCTLSSCRRDDPQEKGGTQEVILTVDEESEIRSWHKGDVLKVHYAASGQHYAFTCFETGENPRFRGTVAAADAGTNPDGILFPYSERPVCKDAVWSGVEIPGSQSGETSVPLALGYAERSRIVMMSPCAQVVWKISGAHHLTAATLRGLRGETLSGVFSYRASSSLVKTGDEQAHPSVTFAPDKGLDLSGGTEIRFWILPGHFAEGLSVEITRAEGGTGTVTFPGELSIPRRGVQALPEKVLLPSDFGLSPAEDGERVVNGGFEAPFPLGKVSEAGIGNWAYIGGWTQSSAARPEVEVVEGAGVGGSKAVRIASTDYFADQCVAQVITGLVPDAPYVMTAKIKAQGVSETGSGGQQSVGAHIAVHIDSPIWPKHSEGVYGTSGDWQEVRLEFEPKTPEVLIRARLGGSAADTKGAALFDDVSVRYNEGMYIRSGEHVRLMVEQSYIDASSVSQEQIDTWLGRLDRIYEQYMELFGGHRPYDGGRITIRSATINAWAYAGNPIQWNRNYIVSTLDKNIARGCWCFGLMHELGHDFAPGHFTEYQGATSAWDFNEELFANFRMFYAIDNLGEEVTVINNAGSSREKIYHGREITALYKSDESNSYDKTIALGRAVEMGNALTWCCVRIADTFGWQVWKDTFAELYRIPATEVNTTDWTQWDKFQYLLDALNRHVPAGRDVRETFTESELSVIEAWLKTQK